MLSEKQLRAIDSRLSDLETIRPTAPVLRADLVSVFEAWAQFGLPAQLGGGGMVHPSIQDLRPHLYVPRRAWLDENGLQGCERTLYLKCWTGMDEEYVSILTDQLAEALKDN